MLCRTERDRTMETEMILLWSNHGKEPSGATFRAFGGELFSKEGIKVGDATLRIYTNVIDGLMLSSLLAPREKVALAIAPQSNEKSAQEGLRALGKKRSRRLGKAAIPHVLQKDGMYYGHNSAGYVHSFYMAELYSAEYARRHAKASEDVRAIPITDLVQPDQLRAIMERLQRIEAAFNSEEG